MEMLRDVSDHLAYIVSSGGCLTKFILHPKIVFQ